MAEGFFQSGTATDPAYVNVRDKNHLRVEDARKFCEELWVKHGPYADRTFLSDAKNHFQQRFWEMYLGVTLTKKGFKLTNQGDTGPEFYFMVGEKKVWVEAVAPGPGDGQDAVREPEGKDGDLTEEMRKRIILRYTHALRDKLNKYNEAVKKGIIGVNDCYVIAVNCRAIPGASLGFTLPYYLNAYIGAGDLVVEIDRQTGKIVDRYHEFKGEVTKKKRAPVSTAPLLTDEYAGISGVLHSAVDPANRPKQMGDDFEFLHNPLASQPIERSVFSFCRQYVYSPERGELQTLEPSQVNGN